MLFEEVRVSKQRLQDLSRQLVQVHEEERRWLARELHDEIGQHLTALKLQLEQISISKKGKNNHISMSQKMINELIQKVRQMSLDLRPSLLDDLGLLPAFEWFFDRYQTQTGIEVLFTNEGLQRRRFAPDLEITAFRVVQEALTNAARYAKASSVSVDIQVMIGEINVKIEDKGVGFDLDSDWIYKSSGIMGMMERVNLINGKFEIISSPGNGTKIYLILPIIMEH
jgi:signal transduction histidine kinase